MQRNRKGTKGTAHHLPTARAWHVSGGLEPEDVRVWLLGDFRVSVGSRAVQGNSWRLKKAQGLVKLLALARGHKLHREQIMAALWPDLGAKSQANNLHRALHFARGALESTRSDITSRYLALQGDLLALCPDGTLWVDVEAFESAAASARLGREPGVYRAAIELYTGELLPEDRYEEWTEEKREELRQLYLALLVELAGLHKEREEYEPASEALRQAVAEEPAKEDAHAALMHLYYLMGRSQEAIFQYERLSEALSKELDEKPSATSRRLHEEIRAGSFLVSPPSHSIGRPSEEATDSFRHNLPASLTSFVGREDALLEVKRLLAMTRLLTLTGSGGSGKTRLALEVARDLVGAYPEGVWMVELAPLLEPALVPHAVAAALGVREQPGRSVTQTLSHYLKSRNVLLVLDNCEHLVDATARLAHDLLKACSKLRVLATSREFLGVPGEAVWRVPPLSLPDVERSSSIESLMRTEAVRLFVDRARSRLPDFELKRGDAGAVARVCRKLDGIPLAIELATARMGALAVEQVAQKLEDSLGLLTGGSRTVEPRQRTLRATLDWSYELLDEPERKLFRQLSIFAGGWALEAAAEVCSGDGIEQDSVLDLLSKLVDKSLVVAEAEEEGALRYRMLETVRQYGQERLEAACPEAERVRERHARYYLAIAEEAVVQEPGLALKESRPVAWLERMAAEHGNLRAALSWALDREEVGEHEEELGLRLAVAMWWFWYTHDYQSEGRRYLERALSGRSNPATKHLRARALIGAGWMALTRADFVEAKALMEEGLSLCRELGDKEGIASALSELGWVAVLGQRDDIPIAAVFEELMELKPQLENRNTLAYLLLLEGAIVGSQGAVERAATLHEESLELFREMHDEIGTIMCLSHFGLVELLRADYDAAASLLREALRRGWVLDLKPGIQVCLYGLACVAASLEQPIRAVRLWGAVEGMREAYGVHLTPITRSVTDYEGYLITVRSQLGEEAFAAVWAEGEAMPLERTIEYALSLEEPSLPATSEKPQMIHTDEPADPLTRRQLEVALLIGRGLTNHQIADALKISKNTVANHVAQILRKLNLSSRSKIIVWVTEKRLRGSKE